LCSLCRSIRKLFREGNQREPPEGRIGELQADGETQAQMMTQMQTQAPAKIMELVEKLVSILFTR
jgi:hypothetical protein